MTIKCQLIALLGVGVLMSGCAADGSLDLMTTGSIDQAAAANVAAKPQLDPACIELAAKIDALRKEGTPERIAKVAEGKTESTRVKRSALARMTELDAANQDFQSKCSTLGTTAAAPASATDQVKQAAQAASAAASTAANTAASAGAAAETAKATVKTAKSAATAATAVAKSAQ